MKAIEIKENASKEMYNLLLDYELKIGELSKYIRERKNGKANLTAANEMNRLKLHRKILKNNLKWMKTATDKQWRKYKEEIQNSFKKAQKAFLKSDDTLSGKVKK